MTATNETSGTADTSSNIRDDSGDRSHQMDPTEHLVPQLASHGISFDELKTAVRVLNAVAALASSHRLKQPKKEKTFSKQARNDSEDCGGDQANDVDATDSTTKNVESVSSKKRARNGVADSSGIDHATIADSVDCSTRKFSSENGDGHHNSDNDSDIESGLEAYKDSNLRPLRKALARCIELHQRTMFDGKTTDQYYEHRNELRSLKRQKMAERDQQKKHLANTALRRGRMERLREKQKEGADEETWKLLKLQQFTIPDGHVETTTAIKQLLDAPLVETVEDESTAVGTGNSTMEPQEESVNLPKLRSCYVCKTRFRELHHFYDQLCPSCAALNWEKRHQTTNLHGKVAVVTGSRVKIGYQTCLKLLRAGATVVATTRFPNAAVHSYRTEPDFREWKDRLQVYGLDLRDVTGIEAFCRYLKLKFADCGLDILINNACQTIRRPRAYYLPACEREEELWKEADDTHRILLSGCMEFERIRRRLLLEHKQEHQSFTSSDVNALSGQSRKSRDDGSPVDKVKLIENEDVSLGTTLTTTTISATSATENTAIGALSFESSGMSHSAAASQMILLPEDVGVSEAVLPKGATDINGQQLDLRTTNSWLLKMDEVSTPEVMECMFINAIAPFVLNSRLKPLMCVPATHGPRYIVNVSAMEGKFYRYKMPAHPHTNMAKASLNMMTRTSSEDLAKNHNIYMNSIDTGWINDENPLERASKTAAVNNFQTPIDEIDAAARIVDPIFSRSKEYGKFLKDYRETEW